MREKIVAQPELDFDPQMLKITQEFHSKYERISEILDQTPLILNQAHADLESLAEEESPGRSRYATDTVLRLCVCQVIEGRRASSSPIRPSGRRSRPPSSAQNPRYDLRLMAGKPRNEPHPIPQAHQMCP